MINQKELSTAEDVRNREAEIIADASLIKLKLDIIAKARASFAERTLQTSLLVTSIVFWFFSVFFLIIALVALLDRSEAPNLSFLDRLEKMNWLFVLSIEIVSLLAALGFTLWERRRRNLGIKAEFYREHIRELLLDMEEKNGD